MAKLAKIRVCFVVDRTHILGSATAPSGRRTGIARDATQRQGAAVGQFFSNRLKREGHERTA
jgi:hypothetical protein